MDLEIEFEIGHNVGDFNNGFEIFVKGIKGRHLDSSVIHCVIFYLPVGVTRSLRFIRRPPYSTKVIGNLPPGNHSAKVGIVFQCGSSIYNALYHHTISSPVTTFHSTREKYIFDAVDQNFTRRLINLGAKIIRHSSHYEEKRRVKELQPKALQAYEDQCIRDAKRHRKFYDSDINDERSSKKFKINNFSKTFGDITNVSNSDSDSSTRQASKNMTVTLYASKEEHNMNYNKVENFEDTAKYNNEKYFADKPKYNKEKKIEDKTKYKKEKYLEDKMKFKREKYLEDKMKYNREKKLEDKTKYDKEKNRDKNKYNSYKEKTINCHKSSSKVKKRVKKPDFNETEDEDRLDMLVKKAVHERNQRLAMYQRETEVNYCS